MHHLSSVHVKRLVIGLVGFFSAAGGVAGTPMDPVDADMAVLDCDVCPPMVKVPAGTFLLGTPEDEPGHVHDVGPQKSISIDEFAVSRYEVTLAEYTAFISDTGFNDNAGCLVMGEGGGWYFDPEASWQSPGFSQESNHPVTCVSATAADAYVRWLNTQAKGAAYRLLSESEWEYVGRAGSTTPYWWGEREDDFCEVTNGADQTARAVYPGWKRTGDCNDGYLYTAPVGRYGRANPFGLYDTAGNVWEWVADCYVDNYESHPADGKPVTASDCEKRSFRGGAWGDYGSFYLRTGYRGAWSGAQAFANIGIRVAADLVQ